jgi:hypothetical protein
MEIFLKPFLAPHVASVKTAAAATALCSSRTLANVQTAVPPKKFPNRTDLFYGNRKMLAPHVSRS